eukprot:6177214-Pleurochrysis_carterae.AAC.4
MAIERLCSPHTVPAHNTRLLHAGEPAARVGEPASEPLVRPQESLSPLEQRGGRLSGLAVCAHGHALAGVGHYDDHLPWRRAADVGDLSSHALSLWR